MNKKLLEGLMRYFGKDNLQDLLDESSRRFKISRYNDNWNYSRPEGDTSYAGGIKWDPYRVGDMISSGERYGSYTPEEAKELYKILREEKDATLIPYAELPNYYKDSYDSAFDLPVGPRDQETLDFLAQYGSDTDTLASFGEDWRGAPVIKRTHPEYSDMEDSLEYFLKNKHKFGNKQINPVTGDLMYNRGDEITQEALDKIKNAGIEKFFVEDMWYPSTDIARNKYTKDLVDRLRKEAGDDAKLEDVYAAYLNTDEHRYEYPNKRIGLFSPRLADFDLYDYNEKKEAEKNRNKSILDGLTAGEVKND